MNINNLKLDKEVAAKGKWFRFGEDGPEFLLASVHSEAFKKRVSALMREQSRFLQKPGVIEKIQDEVFAEKCLLDWRGLSSDDSGTVFHCTAANKHKVLTECPELKGWLNEKSATVENFQSPEAIAEDAESLKSVAGVVPQLEPG